MNTTFEINKVPGFEKLVMGGKAFHFNEDIGNVVAEKRKKVATQLLFLWRTKCCLGPYCYLQGLSIERVGTFYRDKLSSTTRYRKKETGR